MEKTTMQNNFPPRAALRGLIVVTTLVALWSFGALAQREKTATDPRLENKVTYSTQQASVQYIVMDLARQAGLKYDFKKSQAQTDPLCRRYVRDVSIKGKPCREALDKILKPVGLRYEIENDTIVLYRK
jgi:hypothetical protein